MAALASAPSNRQPAVGPALPGPGDKRTQELHVTFFARPCSRVKNVLAALVVLFTAAGTLAAQYEPPVASNQHSTVPLPAVQTSQDRTAAAILIKNTILAVNQGNLTGNYTVLRDLSSPGFRERNSAADLAAIFQNIRQQKIDLSPIVALEPVTNPPKVSPDGQLILEGYFTSQALRINFHLAFLRAGSGGWMIHGVSLHTAPESPTVADRLAPTTGTFR
jgi:hypothetical protein